MLQSFSLLSRRDRNQMANNWEQSRKENAARFVAAEPSFSPLKFSLADKKIASPMGDEDTSKPQCNPIRYCRAKPGTECARSDNTVHVQFSFCSKERRWRNHDFAGHWEDRTLHSH